MDSLVILLGCFFVGIVCRAVAIDDFAARRQLNAFIIYISLPAMTLTYLHGIKFSPSLLAGVLMPWGLFLLACAFFGLLGKAAGWSKEVIGTLILLGGIGSTSFLGMPMLHSLKGPEAIPVGLAIDQMGTYLVLSTLALLVASFYGSKTKNWGTIAVKVITYPPFVAMVLALALGSYKYPAGVAWVLSTTSDSLAPLAMLSVGMQVSFSGISAELKPLLAGLAFKLLVAPAVVFAMYVLCGTQLGMTQHVVILQAAMGPAITASIIAVEHEFQPRLVTLLLSFGVLLSVATVPALNYLLVHFVK